jgi:acyl-CoA synthetase (AMP-forming)/AMP-acid ligase II
MGFVLTLAQPLAAGATVVTLGRYGIVPLLEAIETHGVTVLLVPPPAMAALAHHPRVDHYDLSSLELVASGGAPLSADLQRAVGARLPGAAVGQGWGMTETAVSATLPDRRTGSVPGSVGRVAAGGELRVVDPHSGQDLGPNRRGELWVRGPQVMAGYHRRPDATAELLDGDGWVHTGDLGYVDDDGNVFVVDRLKDLIKVSAHQVAPAELEAVLAAHPAVVDAAVVGRDDAVRGEVPCATVVAGARVGEDALLRWVAERVAPYKRVHAIRFVEAIPRTPAGKILRRQVDALLAADVGQ